MKKQHEQQKRWKKDSSEEQSHRKYKQKSQESFLNSEGEGDSHQFHLDEHLQKHVPKKRSESYNNQRRGEEYGDNGMLVDTVEKQKIEYEYI